MARNARQIGGVGVRVEIDEALLSKRKYHRQVFIIMDVVKFKSLTTALITFFRGRVVPPRWVFGGISPTTKEGFIVFVPNRCAHTLLPLIQDNIAAGSYIHSDAWAGYHQYD